MNKDFTPMIALYIIKHFLNYTKIYQNVILATLNFTCLVLPPS